MEIQAGVYKRARDPHLPANPVISAVFQRLTAFLCYPIIPVCVFDGPERPELKRDKKVAQTPFAIVNQVTRLISALGFYAVMVC